MFGAIGRYFSALGYLLTGRIDKARQALETDPNVIRATYDDVVRQKRERIQEFMSAVAGLIRQQESKKGEMTRLQSEIETHKRVMDGALAAAKKRAALLQGQGKSPAEVQQDAEFLKHQSAYTDVKSTSQSKQTRVEQLKLEIAKAQEQINKHKINLESMQRDISGLKIEASDAVARVISAKEEKALADMLTGLSEDKSGEQLNSLRDAVGRVEAEARVSSELAGTDAAASQAQYLAYAADTASSDEFSQLVGLAEKVEARAATPSTATPEVEKLS